jgi:hypothetical protein
LIIGVELPVSAMTYAADDRKPAPGAPEVAERAGWQIVEICADEISGTKGRKRPSPSQARSNVDSGVRRSLILR